MDNISYRFVTERIFRWYIIALPDHENYDSATHFNALVSKGKSFSALEFLISQC